MNLPNGETGRLVADRFVVNVALPEETQGGLAMVNRDPRKVRKRPPCYKGIVEEVGPGVKYIEVGKSCVFERWEPKQADLDSERIIARERDILIYDGIPAPGVIVVELFDDHQIKSSLFLPQGLSTPPKTYHHGKVIASSSRQAEEGDILWIESYHSGQFIDSNNQLYYRANSVGNIFAHWTKDMEAEWKRNQLQVI